MAFLRKSLLPQDRVAFLAYSRATDLTTDHERIARVIERFKKENESVEAMEAQRMSGFLQVFADLANCLPDTSLHVRRQLTEADYNGFSLGPPLPTRGQEAIMRVPDRRTFSSSPCPEFQGGEP